MLLPSIFKQNLTWISEIWLSRAQNDERRVNPEGLRLNNGVRSRTQNPRNWGSDKISKNSKNFSKLTEESGKIWNSRKNPWKILKESDQESKRIKRVEGYVSAIVTLQVWGCFSWFWVRQEDESRLKSLVKTEFWLACVDTRVLPWTASVDTSDPESLYSCEHLLCVETYY